MNSLNHILKYKVKYGVAFLLITAIVIMINFYYNNFYYTYEYYPTGEKMKEYHLRDSLLQGKLYEYYKSGVIKTSEYYENGYKSGIHFYFDKEGKLLYKLHYENAMLKDSISIDWN